MLQSFQLAISDNLGSVTAELINSDHIHAVMTLAHGAGAGMNHSFMIDLAHELADLGIATLRFNFPYMENKKKRPDVPAIAQKTIDMAVQKAHSLFPNKPLWVAGKSFGGRMSSQYLAAHSSTVVKGVVFFGFPLHPAGKPSIDRAEHLKSITHPMLFLQGTKDALAELDLIEKVVEELPLATLVKFNGADHAFKSGKLNLIPLLAQTSNDWLVNQLKK